MAYPFRQMPTLKEFIDYAVSCGCKYRVLTGLVGPRGPVEERILTREIGNVVHVVRLAAIDDSERLIPSVLESYEFALHIEFPTFQ